MAGKSQIEWTDATWNFLKGCTPVSAGCLNCYAAGVAHQKQSHPNPKVSAQFAGLTVMKRAGEGQRAVFNGRINVVEHLIEAPLRWKEPKRIFVNSLSDLFHPDVPVEVIDRAFGVMALCPQHTFQILTKRPERMAAYLADDARGAVDGLLALHHATARVEQWPLPNVWLGTSVEDQAAANERIPHLLRAPAAVRFLSCEPLLGPVDLTRWMPNSKQWWVARCTRCGFVASTEHWHVSPGMDDESLMCPKCDTMDREDEERGLSWVIVGGESGAHARPMHPDWARALRDQCQAAGVPYLFKQWGEYIPMPWKEAREIDPLHHGYISPIGAGMPLPRPADGATCYGPESLEARGCVCVARIGKHAAGRELDGRTWDEFPDGSRDA